MKIKKIFAIATAVLMFAVQTLSTSALTLTMDEAMQEAEETTQHYYIQTFIISAYYSPLEGQENYATGSYSGDIYLNGNGTNGADGTEVYPGMIAAPKKYEFDTKMMIPGVGLVGVHDRGGAILVAGEKGYEWDRLDVWMGFGDIGLTRALQWGKRTVDVMVYGVNDNIKEEIYLEDYTAAESFIQNTFLSPLTFPTDIYYGSDGEEVEKLQGYLQEWGYLNEISGFYGSDTAQAVFEFQLDYDIVDGPDELGSGHTGPGTRRQIENLIQTGGPSEDEMKLMKGRELLSKYEDLNEEQAIFGTALGLGDSGNTVSLLQEELVNLGFLRLEPTGYFGEVTEHAVFKFQQSQGIVANLDELGSGYFGPQTRGALNNITEGRFEMLSYLAYQRSELEGGRHIVTLPEEIVAIMNEEE